jgi:hypothetical protein
MADIARKSGASWELISMSRTIGTPMDKPDQIEEKIFTCPECGSHCWGTSSPGLSDMNLAELSQQELVELFDKISVGNCHGHIPSGDGSSTSCRFTWPRSEDGKYFVGTGRFFPAMAVGEQHPRGGS